MSFSWAVAIRFLKEGRLQSILIVSGASLGVAVIVFLTALIDGVQKDLIDKINEAFGKALVRDIKFKVGPRMP